VGGRRVAETAVTVQSQAGAGGRREGKRAQAVAVHVAVVGEHTGSGHVQGDVFGRGVAVVDGHRRVVHGCDGDVDGGDARVGLAVVGLVSEAVSAVVVGGRRVAETAVAVQGQAAVSGLTNQYRAQAV